MSKYKAAVLAYIDDVQQQHDGAEPDEIVDLLRTFDDHPRDERELWALTQSIIIALLEEGSIEAYAGGKPNSMFFTTPGAQS